MDTSAYIPNERRLYVAIRLDDTQVDVDALTTELHALLGTVPVRAGLPAPGRLDVADGYFDYSVTPWDEAEPIAIVRHEGDITVAGVAPILTVNRHTRQALTWLDGDIVKEEIREDERQRNRECSLRDGTLTIRTRPDPNQAQPLDVNDIPERWIADHVGLPATPRTFEHRPYDPDGWVELTEAQQRLTAGGVCEWPGGQHRADRRSPLHRWNPTAPGRYLCEGHFLRRLELEPEWVGFTRRVQVGGTAITDRTQWPQEHFEYAQNFWFNRRGLCCGDTWGNHFGYDCPGGYSRWEHPEEIGRDAAGERLWYGQEDLVVDGAGNPQPRLRINWADPPLEGDGEVDEDHTEEWNDNMRQRGIYGLPWARVRYRLCTNCEATLEVHVDEWRCNDDDDPDDWTDLDIGFLWDGIEREDDPTTEVPLTTPFPPEATVQLMTDPIPAGTVTWGADGPVVLTADTETLTADTLELTADTLREARDALLRQAIPVGPEYARMLRETPWDDEAANDG